MNARTPRPPLLTRSLAFPCAAFAAFGAGQLWTGARSSGELVDLMGIKLPLLTRIVHDAPLGVVSCLLLVAAGILAGAHFGAPEGWSDRAARSLRLLSQTSAALGVFLTGLTLSAYPLAFSTIHLALQQ